jgi:hypothetical protein
MHDITLWPQAFAIVGIGVCVTAVLITVFIRMP